jgi:elongation factor 1-alpha
MSATGGKTHLSTVICGHVDSGKSTTTGRLLFELGGLSERELTKLKDEAKALNKESFCFAFYMDRQKDERERGITIACTTKEFKTDRYHYSIIDAPGHRDYIKNYISGASSADVGVLMIPSGNEFITAIAKGDHKAGEVQGQSRQHARLLLLLGVKQLVVCVNKMDNVKYEEEKFNEVRDEARRMLVSVGYKKSDVDSSVPILPISGWQGDNLLKQSDKMPWWKGVEVKKPFSGEKITLVTLLDAFDKYAEVPPRHPEKALRVPISNVYSNIKGVGCVIAGCVEQGTLKPGDEVKFMPSSLVNESWGKVFSIEMHHKSVASAVPGDNVGICVKGLDKDKMPTTGDIIVLRSDNSLKKVTKFTAQVQILDHPGELKPGYTPSGYVRTDHAPCKLVSINWKIGKETGNQKVENPPHLKANEMAEIVMEPVQPICMDAFANCEGLGRIAFMDGNSAVMLGRVLKVE